jgi:hypothetical protein
MRVTALRIVPANLRDYAFNKLCPEMTQIFADEQKQPRRDFLRLASSRLRSASKHRSGAATAVSPWPPIFPLNFIKTTISLALPQIRRENEVQPFVCLLLPFYFPTEFTFGSSKQRIMRSN